MKTLIFFFLLLFSQNSFSQDFINFDNPLSTSELQKVEQAVDLYYEWNSAEDPKRAVILLETLHKKNPANWIALFWASYISSQIGNAVKDEIEYLEYAQVHLDNSYKALGESDNEYIKSQLKGLQSLIFRLKAYRKEYDSERDSLLIYEVNFLNEALKLDPTNPTLWVLSGSALGNSYNTSKNLSQLMGAYTLFSDANSEFKEKNKESVADIYFWNEVWVKPWLSRLTPPKIQAQKEQKNSKQKSREDKFPNDFDFILGEWEVQNQQLKERLSENNEWIEFPAKAKIWKRLDGMIIEDEFTMEKNRELYTGASFRIYNPKTEKWIIYWASNAYPELGLLYQVTGKFSEPGVGEFYGKEDFNGKKIRLRFLWKKVSDDQLYWEQAYFDEEKKEWETNWTMHFTRT